MGVEEINATWLYPYDYYDPSYPGIPCNSTSSPLDACISLPTFLIGCFAIITGTFLCVGCIAWRQNKRISQGADSQASEKTNLIAKNIV